MFTRVAPQVLGTSFSPTPSLSSTRGLCNIPFWSQNILCAFANVFSPTSLTSSLTNQTPVVSLTLSCRLTALGKTALMIPVTLTFCSLNLCPIYNPMQDTSLSGEALAYIQHYTANCSLKLLRFSQPNSARQTAACTSYSHLLAF